MIDAIVIAVSETNAVEIFADFIKNNPGEAIHFRFPTFELKYIPLPENADGRTGIVCTGGIVSVAELEAAFAKIPPTAWRNEITYGNHSS